MGKCEAGRVALRMMITVLALASCNPLTELPPLGTQHSSSSSVEHPVFDFRGYGGLWLWARVKVAEVGEVVFNSEFGSAPYGKNRDSYDDGLQQIMQYQYRPVRLDVLETYASRGMVDIPVTISGWTYALEDSARVRNAIANGDDYGIPGSVKVGDEAVVLAHLTPIPEGTPPGDRGLHEDNEWWLYHLQEQAHCASCPIAGSVYWFVVQGDCVVAAPSSAEMDQAEFFAKLRDLGRAFPPPNGKQAPQIAMTSSGSPTPTRIVPWLNVPTDAMAFATYGPGQGPDILYSHEAALAFAVAKFQIAAPVASVVRRTTEVQMDHLLQHWTEGQFPAAFNQASPASIVIPIHLDNSPVVWFVALESPTAIASEQLLSANGMAGLVSSTLPDPASGGAAPTPVAAASEAGAFKVYLVFDELGNPFRVGEIERKLTMASNAMAMPVGPSFQQVASLPEVPSSITPEP